MQYLSTESASQQHSADQLAQHQRDLSLRTPGTNQTAHNNTVNQPQAVPAENETAIEEGIATQQPVIHNNDHSSSDHPADWNNNYERVINIYYYEHYHLDGGVSGQIINKQIIQMAVNGRWEALDWFTTGGNIC